MRLLAALLLGLALPALAQDYERERRWASEIAPSLVVGDAVYLKSAQGREFLGLYAAGGNSGTAVLLVHGIGVHPDHGVIGVLRVALSEMGYATLSIQMPVLGSDAAPADYPPLFAEAAERIGAGARWLKDRGAGRVVLLSHSLGSAMSGAYIARTPDAPFAAWVCMGLGGKFGDLRNLRGPVLDLLGDGDLPGVLRDEWRRRLALGAIPGSRQVTIPGADHHYSGREKELASAIAAFMAALK